VSLRDRRIQYETEGLDRGDLTDDPIEQWTRWYEQAAAASVAEPNAMTISTVDEEGIPDARVVLARGVDQRGFIFYSNVTSDKGRQLASRPVAAAVFAWLDLHRQVRVRGSISPLDAGECDAYFASRPRGSQIGAWASPQSRPIADRAALEQLVDERTREFEGRDVPRPEFWSGWLLRPQRMEFWQGRPSRLHDRFRYERSDEGWTITRLAP
jgi:pyridoxamine 5'-phosphate oxidase